MNHLITIYQLRFNNSTQTELSKDDGNKTYTYLKSFGLKITPTKTESPIQYECSTTEPIL